MNLPNRKSPRLQGYDYNQDGAYFITICSDQRRLLFSDITGAPPNDVSVNLTAYGDIAKKYIQLLPQKYDIILHAYVIMPNHIHLLFLMTHQITGNRTPLETRSYLDKMIGYLKMNISKEIHQINSHEKVWQRSYHDSIIRSEKKYLHIWNYIQNNPMVWQYDCFYSEQNGSTPAL
ncbi:MAG: transposase [Clostridia bacterium]|nr:transposase [Clostridia bacterium]